MPRDGVSTVIQYLRRRSSANIVGSQYEKSLCDKSDASGMRRVAAIRILSHPEAAKLLDFLTISIPEGDS
jgi:hypothetical protein